jgi:S-(hydroxymethyl)glutathione dehydrogenase/alcohol dehydrogenase
MKASAAILVELGAPLVLEELEIPPLQPGQVLVEVAYSGVCHTQILEARGHKGPDKFLPHCMGHEGSGIVLDIGPSVTRVRPEDRVLLSWLKASGLDVASTKYASARGIVNAGGVATFAQRSIASENRLTKLPDTVSLKSATMLGCAAATGIGSVFNTLTAKPGASIAVLGCGGIGLCAIAASRSIGCNPIIAIDINESKLEMARQFGATHTINSASHNVTNEVLKLTDKGADFAVEATGRPSIMALSLEIVRPQGGISVVIGNAHFDERLTFDPKQLNMGKQLRGTWGGDSVPDRDFAHYLQLLEDGHLPLHLMSSRQYSLAEINSALDDLEAGRVVRPVIDRQSPIAAREAALAV